jgi:HlyD family secretion protein
VKEIRYSPQTVQNVVTYDAVVAVDNGELKLRPGMTADVSFLVDERRGVLLVPNAALRFQPPPEVVDGIAPPPAPAPAPEARGRQRVIWTLDGGGRIAATPVAIGVSDGRATEVTGEGISEGLEVVIGIAGEPAPGTPGSPRGNPRFGRFL